MLASHTRLGTHDTYLGDFTQSSAFFSEVNDNAAASVLGFLDSLLDSKNDYKQSGVSFSEDTQDAARRVVVRRPWAQVALIASSGCRKCLERVRTNLRYGRQVQMSEPKTSLPLHYVSLDISAGAHRRSRDVLPRRGSGARASCWGRTCWRDRRSNRPSSRLRPVRYRA